MGLENLGDGVRVPRGKGLSKTVSKREIHEELRVRVRVRVGFAYGYS